MIEFEILGELSSESSNMFHVLVHLSSEERKWLWSFICFQIEI